MVWSKRVWAGFILFGLREAWLGFVSTVMKRLFLQKAEHFFDKLWELPVTEEGLCSVQLVVDCPVRKTVPVLRNLSRRISLRDAAPCLC
jgi:hypothetical protein